MVALNILPFAQTYYIVSVRAPGETDGTLVGEHWREFKKGAIYKIKYINHLQTPFYKGVKGNQLEMTFLGLAITKSGRSGYPPPPRSEGWKDAIIWSEEMNPWGRNTWQEICWGLSQFAAILNGRGGRYNPKLLSSLPRISSNCLPLGKAKKRPESKGSYRCI